MISQEVNDFSQKTGVITHTHRKKESKKESSLSNKCECQILSCHHAEKNRLFLADLNGTDGQCRRRPVSILGMLTSAAEILSMLF